MGRIKGHVQSTAETHQKQEDRILKLQAQLDNYGTNHESLRQQVGSQMMMPLETYRRFEEAHNELQGHVRSTGETKNRILELQAQLDNHGTKYESLREQVVSQMMMPTETHKSFEEAHRELQIRLDSLEAQRGQDFKKDVVEEQIVQLHVKLEDCENNQADLRQLVQMVKNANESTVVVEEVQTEKYVGNAALVRAVSMSSAQQDECFPDGCTLS